MNKMFASRVKETSSTTGTGTYSLSGSAVTGFRTFAAAFISGQLVYYVAVFGTNWETGFGVFTSGAPSTLTRLSITASSNAGAAVNWGAGSKSVYCDVNPNAMYEPETNLFINAMMGRASVSNFLTITGTSYYVYVGRTSRPYTALHVEMHLTANGTGAQVAEVGLFSTPTAPNKTGLTMTKIVASGTLDSLTGASTVRRNVTPFVQVIPGGTHLWAAVRTAMATAQPTLAGLAGDMLQGHMQTATGTGALTGISSVGPCTIPAISTGTVGPDLRVTNC